MRMKARIWHCEWQYGLRTETEWVESESVLLFQPTAYVRQVFFIARGVRPLRDPYGVGYLPRFSVSDLCECRTTCRPSALITALQSCPPLLFFSSTPLKSRPSTCVAPRRRATVSARWALMLPRVPCDLVPPWRAHSAVSFHPDDKPGGGDVHSSLSESADRKALDEQFRLRSVCRVVVFTFALIMTGCLWTDPPMLLRSVPIKYYFDCACFHIFATSNLRNWGAASSVFCYCYRPL